MRRVLAATAALILSLPIAAVAQDHRDDHERGRGNPRAAEQAPAPQAQAPQAQAPQNNPRENRGQGVFGRTAPPAPAPNVTQERGRERPNAAQPAPAPNVAQERSRERSNTAQPAPAPNFAQERGFGAQRAQRDNAPRGNFAQDRDRDRGRDFNGDRGRDFRGDRDRGGRVFNFRGREYAAMRAPAYSYPRGWGYRHWDRGDFLPSVFLAAPFFFDYEWLGLPPPPPDARWVRNGPDALLVSVYDGRILDVIYDAFY